MRKRKSMLLCTALASAVMVAAAQAAPALANPWYIQAKLAGGTTAQLLNASNCADPAQIIQWPFTPGAGCPGGGSNQVWRTTNGDWPTFTHTAIYASYGGHNLCMNVKGNVYAAGTPVIAYGCNPSNPAGNELWIIHPWPGGYYIQAVNDTALCLNIKGGFGQGHPVILYGCNTAYNNEVFVPDRL
jgi:hypothetical protein